MRSTTIVVTLLACLGIAGCTSSSGVDGLAPSLETTSSIPRPEAAVPQADVGAAASVEAVVQDAQGEESAESAEPEVTPIALVAAPKPALREAPYAGGEIHRRRFRDAKPINFGRRSPAKLAVHGVDVSRWQGEIDWLKLRSQGANFAYIKATDGGDHLDPMFRKNWRAAGEAGLRRGAYHFFYWCRTAGEQADWFIRNVPKVAGALPPVIDVEWNGDSKNCRKRPSRAKVLEKMQVFMDRLEAHYGQRPIIYTAPDFYRDNLRDAFADHPFWLRSVAAHPAKVYPGRKWVFWQYSGSGLSHGVEGRIDLNVFHGDESEWRAWVGSVAG
jgi:lysozyme